MLRDVSEPRRTLPLSDRAENLEAIEDRLKNDILQEATRLVYLSLKFLLNSIPILHRYGGLLLTHNEVGMPGLVFALVQI